MVAMTQLPVMTTPHVATPQIFQQAMPPWVTQTPESSPMLWGRAPGEYLKPFPLNLDPKMPNISKEFLRSVCQPFFDEMLEAVYQAVLAQKHQTLDPEDHGQSMEYKGAPGHSTTIGSLSCAELSSRPTSLEDGSDVGDFGAFSSVFAPITNDEDRFKGSHPSIPSDELSNAVSAVSNDVKRLQRDMEIEAVSEHGSDPDKSVMVCRHWKSKGFCRMEDNCKFLHPEHKRGVGPMIVNSTKAGGVNGSSSADMSNGLAHGMSVAHDGTDPSKKKSKKTKDKKEKKVEDTSNMVELDWQRGTLYTYEELLTRLYQIIEDKNPTLGAAKKYTLKPPQVVRVGSKKVGWVNFKEICDMMKRSSDHVIQFVLAEFGTEGSITPDGQLILKGRYQPKHAESLLRKYIKEFVTCEMCKSANTILQRDASTRLTTVTCENCNASRTASSIKTGYHAVTRADRRAAKQAK